MAQDLRYLRSAFENLMAKASVIRYVSDFELYMGFPAQGVTSTSEAGWAICQVKQTGTTYPYDLTIKWADGQNQPVHVFEDYASKNYEFPKF